MVLFFRCDVLGFEPTQVVGSHSPAMATVGVDADTLLVPTNNGSLDCSAVVGLEHYAFANAELNHCDLSPQLMDHAKSFNDFPVQGNQFLFGHPIQNNFHGLDISRDRLPALDGQEFIQLLVWPCRQVLKNVLQPFIRVNRKRVMKSVLTFLA